MVAAIKGRQSDGAVAALRVGDRVPGLRQRVKCAIDILLPHENVVRVVRTDRENRDAGVGERNRERHQHTDELRSERALDAYRDVASLALACPAVPRSSAHTIDSSSLRPRDRRRSPVRSPNPESASPRSRRQTAKRSREHAKSQSMIVGRHQPIGLQSPGSYVNRPARELRDLSDDPHARRSSSSHCDHRIATDRGGQLLRRRPRAQIPAELRRASVATSMSNDGDDNLVDRHHDRSDSPRRRACGPAASNALHVSE